MRRALPELERRRHLPGSRLATTLATLAALLASAEPPLVSVRVLLRLLGFLLFLVLLVLHRRGSAVTAGTGRLDHAGAAHDGKGEKHQKDARPHRTHRPILAHRR